MTSTTFTLAISGFGAILAGMIARRRDHVMFAAALMAAAIASAAIAVQHSRLVGSTELLERIEFAVSLAAGPLLWLYARQCAGKPFRRELLAHFLPAAAAFAMPPLIELVMLQQFAYTAASTTIAWRTREQRAAVWLRRTVAMFLLAHAAQIVRLSFRHVPELRNVVPITLSLGVLTLALTGFRSALGPSVKYRNAPLPDVSDAFERLEALMRAERLYRDASLSPATLAQRAGLTAHQLSQLLNQHRSTTFRDYVNRFRIADACELLRDPANDRLTVDALAETSGFSSRSTFYAAFRKETGVTPSGYVRAQRDGQSR